MSSDLSLSLRANSLHVPNVCVHVHSPEAPRTVRNPTFTVTSPTSGSKSSKPTTRSSNTARSSQGRYGPNHDQRTKGLTNSIPSPPSSGYASLSSGSQSSQSAPSSSSSSSTSSSSTSSRSTTLSRPERRRNERALGQPGPKPAAFVVANQTIKVSLRNNPIQMPLPHAAPKRVHFTPSAKGTASTTSAPSTTSESSAEQPIRPPSRRVAQLRSPKFPMPATPPVASSARPPIYAQVSPYANGGIEVIGGVPVPPASTCTSATPSTSPSHIGLHLGGLLTENFSTSTLVEASPLLARRVSKERISTPVPSSPRLGTIPLPAQTPTTIRIPLGNPLTPPPSGSAPISMPVPITMPVPEPVGPPISVPPAPSIRKVVTSSAPAPSLRLNVIEAVPLVIAGKSAASTIAPPLIRVPTPVSTHRERTLVRHPSTDSERTAVTHTKQPQSKQDASKALPDLPAARKKGESYWVARGQHLYEDLSPQPKLEDTYPCGALLFSKSCPRIQWNILFPPSTAVDMTVGDGMSTLKEKYLDSPATTPSLKVVNLIIPDQISGAWTIKVTNAERDHLVTVGDVLSALSTNLHMPVYDHEPQWLSLSEKQQTGIARTLHKNRSLAGTQVGGNLRRLDFLEGRNVFVGLSRDYAKCGLPMWKKFIPGLKPFGEEMWNFWVVELEELGPSPPRYMGDR